ncbi:MAG: phospholipase D family protein [Bdellovibrionaceae bacterium]|nr:phospholipase D family protein [Pseudobdellovibrionaceae bacterium]
MRSRLCCLLILFIVQCQSIPKNYAAMPSHAVRNVASTKLAQRLEPQLAQHPGLNGFYPLAEGTDALIARLAAAHVAEKTLDIQYYIWQDDMAGRLVMEAILEAADRGVRVRLLLDDLNIGTHEDPLLTLDTHPNIEVRMFNPFANRKVRFFEIVRFDQANRRMHNKTFITDNLTAIVGGRNIGNEYFMASKEMNFGDYDVWVTGPIVPEISKSFDAYWNHELAVPITALNKRKVEADELAKLHGFFAKFREEVRTTPYAYALEESELRRHFNEGTMKVYWGKGEFISDSPDKLNVEKEKAPEIETHRMRTVQRGLSRDAQKELFFVTPYFIPGKEGVGFFERQIKRGVKVTILTNSLASSDVVSVFPGYKRYRADLLKVGVELYELKPRGEIFRKAQGIGSGSQSGLHAKVYAFDRERLFIGSMNLDPRSLEVNSELGVIVESPDMTTQFVEPLARQLPTLAYKVSLDASGDLHWTTLEDGKTVILQSEPEATLWRRLKSTVYSWIMPETML